MAIWLRVEILVHETLNFGCCPSRGCTSPIAFHIRSQDREGKVKAVEQRGDLFQVYLAVLCWVNY